MVAVRLGRTRKLRRYFTVPERWCYVAGVLTIAAKAPVRGRLLVEGAPADEKDVAEEAGVSIAVAARTLDKLRTHGMLLQDDELACERVHDWDEHNPEPKKDKTAAERSRRYREKLKRERNGVSNASITRDATSRHGPEVEGEEKRSSFANAQEQKVKAETVMRVSTIFADAGLVIDDESVERAVLRYGNRDLIVGAIGCVQWLQKNPRTDIGVTFHRYLEREPVVEEQVGRSKQQRAADGIAAIQRVVGEEPA